MRASRTGSGSARYDPRAGCRPDLAPPGAGLALLGFGFALLGAHVPLPGGDARWRRTNHRGAVVSLASGPALAVAAALTAGSPQPAAVLAGMGAGLLGAYDDAVADASAKGFGGHLRALREGRVTSGLVKLVGIGVCGPAAVALLPGRRDAAGLLLGGGIVAGTANLLNLLDLRPGRALKAGLLLAAAVREPGPAAAAAALLPGDLAERSMLGDAGANALGAVLGLAAARRAGSRRTQVAVLGVLAGLTAASEVVSFSSVIDAVPPLRALDRLGRR